MSLWHWKLHLRRSSNLNGKEFAKISKMEITFLVDLVALAGFLSNPSFYTKAILVLPLIVAGSLGSMSAALFNNLYDMDIDGSMKRTSYRTGIVNSNTYRRMFAYGILMLAASMLISYFTINLLTALFIFLGFLSYVFLYTIFLKRRTTWNIVIGGIAGSFPAFAGWAAVSNSISFTAAFIAFLVFLWTPTHFWSLATGNAEDYKNANVPMLPAVVGTQKSSTYIIANTALLFAYSILPIFFKQINVGPAYYVFAVVLGAILLYYTILPVKSGFSKQSFKKAFHFSNYYLMILLIAICLVNFLH